MIDDTKNKETLRIGVYLCHCGSNIAGMVDINKVARHSEGLGNVALVRDYRFMCSEPGQELIKQDIIESKLDRVVVAACSPLMHEQTFREACEEAGLNRYLFEMANVREHCAWVTRQGDRATEKAKALVSAAVAKAVYLEPLETKRVPVNPNTVVVGGGIAGIQAALNIAESGKKVYLVERSPTIGGYMSHFDKTFPTLDCSACILTPKMVAVGKHPNIELLTMSEIDDVSGYVGNFKVRIRKNPRYVRLDRCTGCGKCWEECPSSTSPSDRRVKIGDKVINEKQL